MADGTSSPGPIASHTFDLGFKLAAAGGITVVLALYWTGVLSVTSSLDVALTITLFPVYLLGVAVVLGLWLGYDTGPADLKRVAKEVDSESPESENRR